MDQRIAYELYQYDKAEAQTRQAEKEYQDAINEAKFWTNREGRNLSDAEVKAKVRENFEKKYPTLAKMEAGGYSPIELNRAVDWSDDVLDGAIWLGRNPDSKADINTAMIFGYRGEGNQWQEDPAVSRALKPYNDDGTVNTDFQPYKVGGTNLDEAAMHFGRQTFDKEWIAQNRHLMLDGTPDEQRYMKQIVEGDQNRDAALEAISALEAWKANKLKTGNKDKAKEDLDELLAKKVIYVGTGPNEGKVYSSDGRNRKAVDLSILNKMDESMGKEGKDPTGNLVSMTGSVDYKYDTFLDSVYADCDKRAGQQSGLEKVSGMLTEEQPEQSAVPQAKQPDQPNAPSPQPMLPYTDDEIAQEKVNREKILDASDVLGDGGAITDDEKTVMQNAGDTYYNGIRSALGSLVQNERVIKGFAGQAYRSSEKDYFNTNIVNAQTISVYETARDRLSENEAKMASFTEKWGNIRDYMEAAAGYDPSYEQTVETDDGKEAFHYRLIDGKYELVGMDYDTNFVANNLDSKAGAEYFQNLQAKAEEERERLNRREQEVKAVQERYNNATEEEKRYIDAMRNTAVQIEKDRAYVAEQEQAYNDAKASVANAVNAMDISSTAMAWLGDEARNPVDTESLLEYVSTFIDEPPLNMTSETALQRYDSLAAQYGMEVTDEDRNAFLKGELEQTEQEIQKIQDTIDYLDAMGWMSTDDQDTIDYLDAMGWMSTDDQDNGGMFGNIRQNMAYKLEDLEYARQSLEYSMIPMETDKAEFDKAVEAGKQFQEMLESEALTEEAYRYLDRPYEFDHFVDLADGQEMDVFYYLLGKEVMKNGEEFNTLLTTGDDGWKQALQNIMQTGGEYLNHMIDDDHGVWRSREYDSTVEGAKETVDSGFLGGLGMNALSTGLTPAESVLNTGYALNRLVYNKRINPKASARSISVMKESTRAATNESIDNVFKADEKPILNKLAHLGYEIYCNRGDSAMNALAFGWILPEGTGDIVKELVGASPMGMTAAMTAAAHAIDRGASTDQAWLIFGATFLAETCSEAFTYSNIRGAMGTTKELSMSTVKDYIKKWLTQSGLEEAFGEVFNNDVESLVDKLVLGKNSEFDATVDKYRAEGMEENEAQARALLDHFKDDLHTAFVSYISASGDVIMATGRSAVNTVGYYRSATRVEQRMGNNDASMLGSMLRDWKNRGQQTETEQQATAEPATEATPETAPEATSEETTEQTPVETTEATAEAAPETTAETTKETPAEGESTAAPEVTEGQKNAARDVVTIGQAEGGDAPARTAVLATVLDLGDGAEGTDRANAAAAYLGSVMGEDAGKMVQQAVLGSEMPNAKKYGIDGNTVKQALQFAAMGDGAATQVVQSDEFRNASPEQKAMMLAEALGQDQNDPKVQKNMLSKVVTFRTTMGMNQLAADGHFDQAKKSRQKANKAAANTAKAEVQLQARQEAKEAALADVEQKAQAVAENPTDDNIKQHADAVTRADNADESLHQYEQHLENTQEAQREAEAEAVAEQDAQDAMKSAREIVGEQTAAEDQQRAEEQAARAEQERQAAVEQEKQHIRQEAADNENTADVEGFLDLVRKENPDLTEEDEQKIRDRFARIAKERQTNIEDQRDADGNLTESAKNARNKALEFVNRKFGIPVVLADDITQEDKNGIYSEGFYDEENHRIVLNNDLSFDEAMTRVLPHELLHSLEKSQTYREVVNSLLGIEYGEGADIEQAVKNLEKNNGRAYTRLEQDINYIKSKYDNALNTKHSYRYAAQELAAHRMGEMFYDPANPQRSQDLINRLAAEKPSVAKQIMNSIKSMIKKAFGMKGAWLSYAQETANLFEQALSQNAETNNGKEVPAKPANRTEKLKLLNDIRQRKVDYESGAYRLETIPTIYTNLFDVGELDLTISPRHSYNNMATAEEAKAENMYRKGRKDHYHGLGPEGYMEAIDALDNPVIVMDGRGKDKKASPRISMVVDTKTNGLLLAAIEFYSTQDVVDGDDKRTHALLTIYGKDGLNEYVKTAKDLGRILYVNEKQDHFGAVVQSDSGQSNPAFDYNLTQFNEYVKQWKQNRDIHYSLPEERIAKPAAEESNGNVLTESLEDGTNVKHSLSSWTAEEIRAVRKNLLKNGFTAGEADRWISDVNSIAAVIAADRDRLDFTPDRDQKFKKPNGDVYKWTLDASTLCAKRLLYQGTFNAIQQALPNTPLRPGDLIELANMMHEMGYQTPCGICYVESRRRHLGNFTEEFLADYNGEYKPTYAELTSTDGLAKLKQEHRQAYDDYIAAMNGKGVASPKVVQLRTDYRGDVRNLNKDSIAYLNSIGGLRIQSFSDFETPHLMDMMQAVMDMAAVKLKSQAYTKVPNFAWVFGDTGIKINLSLMGDGTGIDENGNLVFSNTEGMDFEEAMKLRDRYSKNVGTILVGMNDEHIIAAMGDSRIDFIIPFHKSGWSAEELAKMKTLENYTDYQDTQNELWITGKDKDGKYITKSIDKKTGNLDPYGDDGYWDYSKNGRENAEEYLRICAKQKRLPKFSQFLVDNGDGSFSLPKGDDARSTKIREGYWKTLIDFKMYDNDGVGAKQESVMPNINMSEAYRVLNDYVAPEGGNNALPVADPVVERYVEWYKENHQDERFNDQNDDIRYSLPSDDILDDQIRQYLRNGGILSTTNTKTTKPPTSRPLEGKSTKWTSSEGPAERAFGGEGGMLEASDEIDARAIDYVRKNNRYFPDTNEEQVVRAINWVRQNRQSAESDGFSESLAKVTGKSFDYRSADGQARMIAVMAMAAARNDVPAQTALADAFNRQGTDLGRALQARKLFRLMTPEGRIGTLQKMLQNQRDELARKGVTLKDANGRQTDLKLSDWILQAAAAAESEADFRKVEQAAAADIGRQIPANWKDKLQSFRMLSMLGNPRTHIRNIIGNAMFVPAVGLKNKIGAALETANGVKQGERTKTLSLRLDNDIREFAKQDAIANKDLLTGEAKFNQSTLVDREKKAFNGLLQALIDFNGDALEKEDWHFLRNHYKRALGGWMQANGYTVEQMRNDPALLEKGRAYAVQEAQKATYRDFSKIASMLNDISRKGGAAGFVVDAVLPFKKTPANILKRGVEYSPAGLARSLTTDLAHLKQYNEYQKNLEQWNKTQEGPAPVMPEKAISPTQWIDRLASGISGTAVMALGFLLSSAGVVSGGLGDDDDELNKEKGDQKYSIHFNIGGLDFTYTMDWAAPMSMPFFVGAAIQDQLSKEGNFDIDGVINAMASITEPVFNLSMLDGVNTLLNFSNYDDTNPIEQLAGKVASNYATSYVPSALGAVTRTFFDDKQRKAFVKSGEGTGISGTFRYAWEQAKNKIPGLSQQSIAMRDIWGEEKTSSFIERLLENFLSPGYYESYKDDPLMNEMSRVFSATGDEKVIPAVEPAKTINKVALEDKQWDTYKEVRGKTAKQLLTDLMSSQEYANATDLEKAQAIKDAWKQADNAGKKAVFPDINVDAIGPDTASGIMNGAKETIALNDAMVALENGDYDGYEAMVERLVDEYNVQPSVISQKIGNKYRDKYKDAYRKWLRNGEDWGDQYREELDQIESILEETGFSFNIADWEAKVEEEFD